jgi:hypothetical protein
MKEDVVHLAFKRSNDKSVDALVEAIKNAFYSQAGSVSVCEALGCLEIAKAQIIAECAI